ncbi:MAG: hypothetical protein JW936_07050 [Sedimentisphaerales bacterium]|nr:hypothetical protein [Sedimentisphaerales bacterium]
MLYKPSKGRFKDIMVFWHEGKYVLFSMYSKSAVIKSEPGDYRNVWSAESDDGVHWREVGPVIEDAPFPIWAMAVHKVGDKFIMNHGSFGAESKQNVIRFWESTDLRNWEYTGADRDLYPDERWYDKMSRLDCMSVVAMVEDNKTVYYGYATGPGGFLRSEDGINWEGLPHPKIDWGGIQPPPTSDDEGILEIGGCQEIDGRFYLVGGWFNMMGMSGYGTYTLVGDSAVGPFRPDPAAYRLCGNSLRWVALWARFFHNESDLLVNGYMYDGFTYEKGLTWLPPIKKAVVDEYGHLRLGYWNGNDAIKGAAIDLGDGILHVGPNGAEPTKTKRGWEITADPEINSTARLNVPTNIAILDLDLPIEQGVVIEGNIRAYSKESRIVTPGIGFYLQETAEQGTAILLEGLGLTKIGLATLEASKVVFDWQDVIGPGCASAAGIVPGKTHKFKLLVREKMFELYLDDMLAQTFNTTHAPGEPGRTPSRLGLLVQNGVGAFEDVRAWQMNI